MIYVEAPNITQTPNKGLPSIFIAGSISGTWDWHSKLISNLKDLDVVVYNPRRKNFPINDPTEAPKQIKWEFNHIRKADMLCFWFAPETVAPITLYELGAHSMTEKPITIGLDPGYERILDVEIQTKLVRPDIQIAYSFNSFTKNVITMVKSFSYMCL